MTDRHGQLSNAVEEHDQSGEEAVAGNLLAIIGADGVDVGAQEEGGGHQRCHHHLQSLGLVHHNCTLDQRELAPHQRLNPLHHCTTNDACMTHRADISMNDSVLESSGCVSVHVSRQKPTLCHS